MPGFGRMMHCWVMLATVFPSRSHSRASVYVLPSAPVTVACSLRCQSFKFTSLLKILNAKSGDEQAAASSRNLWLCVRGTKEIAASIAKASVEICCTSVSKVSLALNQSADVFDVKGRWSWAALTCLAMPLRFCVEMPSGQGLWSKNCASNWKLHYAHLQPFAG